MLSEECVIEMLLAFLKSIYPLSKPVSIHSLSGGDCFSIWRSVKEVMGSWSSSCGSKDI